MGCGASKIYPIKFHKTEIEYKTNQCIICLESLDSGKITYRVVTVIIVYVY